MERFGQFTKTNVGFLLEITTSTGCELLLLSTARPDSVEIKPHKETTLEAAGRSQRNQIQAAVNQAKWEAAREFCKRNGISFRVITEHDMFSNTKKRKR